MFCLPHKASRDSQTGGAFLEFAIALPLLLMFILALFDFSRFLTVRALLNSAASRAVSMASVADGLDTDCRFVPAEDKTACANRRAQLLREILDMARDLPLRTVLQPTPDEGASAFAVGDDINPAIELVIDRSNDLRAYYRSAKDSVNTLNFDPLLPAGPALRESLADQPIEITLRARVRPFLPLLGTIEIQGYATGFRERFPEPSLPMRIDCRNDEIGAGEGASATCPCMGYVDGSGGTTASAGDEPCLCKPGLTYVELADGSFECKCPSTQPYLLSTGQCSTCQFESPDAANCAVNQRYDPKKCTCEPCTGYKQHFSDPTKCECPGNFLTRSDICTGVKQIKSLSACDCVSCPGEAIANSDHTSCVCNLKCDAGAGQYLDSKNCRCITCSPPKILNSAGTACVCESTCEAGTVQDPNTCTCKPCDSPWQIISGQCRCPLTSTQCGTTGQVVDSKTCSCISCPTPKIAVSGSCKCPVIDCFGGTVDKNTCSCICPSNQPLLINGYCSASDCSTETCIYGAGGGFRPE